uniref:Uncharacterized protein n=1 Tax=Entomoneis paludosa TaxID=265537 RepID=A0A7S2Y8B3_9STRA|mmetsp:Transcript_222/g.579  ORF Transcript_222/g.579 Transcript_222/m.579 type:complete len:126 (+) Transcript_222:245-622(+)
MTQVSSSQELGCTAPDLTRGLSGLDLVAAISERNGPDNARFGLWHSGVCQSTVFGCRGLDSLRRFALASLCMAGRTDPLAFLQKAWLAPETGWHYLHVAVEDGHVEMVRFLLVKEVGVDVNLPLF